ncbi:5'-nucleotidase [Hyphomonas polymorpha PS728]|uniref:5'-nucleotidase n=1 Tax=Hyphomonas polymorpha PS728 TaxID=1280954 RepID=A0A062VI71_9PROT|nr:HAD family acid phosphatase [Hyphomonas polymorpha]KDA00183.1 5'-nucleotidase [Hyphomonas polymorpha PS728]
MKYALPILSLMALAACQTATITAPEPAPAAQQPAAVSAPEGRPLTAGQWLFGSAEAQIMMAQSWNRIAAYAEAGAAARPEYSVILAPGATAEAPEFLACGEKPLAAVFDVDETLIWNLGSAGAFRRMGIEFDPEIWGEWERTGAGKAVAIPGALEGVERIRKAGVEIILNTNREAANVAGNIETIREAGFGDYVHGETLFLKGDTPGGSAKDGRRYAISENYCVIALVGDQLGDIADIFNDKSLSPAARRDLAAAPAFDRLWDDGWFILPNPTYGPFEGSSMEEIFPPETYWAPASKE